ncbi:MAG: alpha/beta fold hydrolase [Paludibacteraceae bacterium]|nr:alpha/beta fold hydrolase [Paludibacteraceae bacterium]
MLRRLIIWIVLCLALFPGRSIGQSILLVPEGKQPCGGWPAVLLMHDHGAYYELGAQKFRDERWVNKFYDGQYIADTLVAHGYVVLAVDARYWGSRRSTLSQTAYYDSLQGEWFNLTLRDDQASIDYLQSLPYVNPRRIAACGFSMGAYRAWQLAAEDRRVRVCCAANWMTTLTQNRQNDSWLSMRRPQLDSVEFYTIAPRIYPRAFLLQYGTEDHLFPVSAVDTCVSHLSQTYRFRPRRFEAKAYRAKHRFTRQHMVDWLDFLKKHL